MRTANLGMSFIALSLVWTAFATPDDIFSPDLLLISRIRQDMPDGWQCSAVRQDGQKGHPLGLEEPVLRLDFAAPGQFLAHAAGFGTAKVSPLIQLYLYKIGERAHVLEMIRRGRVYSSNPPIYFGETLDFIVVTSPSYVNHGIFTDEAKRAIFPMWKALRKHIPNKGDKSVDGLAEPYLH
jgi:hypothetical protein